MFTWKEIKDKDGWMFADEVKKRYAYIGNGVTQQINCDDDNTYWIPGEGWCKTMYKNAEQLLLGKWKANDDGKVFDLSYSTDVNWDFVATNPDSYPFNINATWNRDKKQFELHLGGGRCKAGLDDHLNKADCDRFADALGNVTCWETVSVVLQGVRLKFSDGETWHRAGVTICNQCDGTGNGKYKLQDKGLDEFETCQNCGVSGDKEWERLSFSSLDRDGENPSAPKRKTYHDKRYYSADAGFDASRESAPHSIHGQCESYGQINPEDDIEDDEDSDDESISLDKIRRRLAALEPSDVEKRLKIGRRLSSRGRPIHRLAESIKEAQKI